MSFKREGDDLSLLNVWKRRKVADLFAESIPEDEVAMLKDGQLACVVCRRKVIVNTIAVLKSHRDGLKHKQNMIIFNKEKNHLRQEIDDRIQTTLKKGGDITELRRKKNLLNSPSTMNSGYKVGQLGTKYPPKLKISLCSTSKDVQAESRIEPSTATREKCLSSVTKIKKPFLPCYRENNEKERYADLKSRGWIQSSDGTWGKDQNAEFDSDEETPT